MISNRIKKILGIILQTRESVNISQISEEIGVSERTIYRELPEVTKILNENHIQLDTISKKGLVVIGAKGDKEKFLQKMDLKKDVFIVDPEERIDVILFELLLQDDYVKADAIAIDNGISTPTVRNDMKKIKKKLEDFDLTLDMKKGDGILIKGDRVDKNNYLCNIIIRREDTSVLLKWLNGETIFQVFLKKLEDFGYRDTFMECHNILQGIFHNNDNDLIKLNDQEYMEVIFLFGMMIFWNQKGMPYTKIFEYKEHKGIEKFTIELVDLLQAKFKIELSDVEQEYIEVVLNIAAVYNFSGFYTIRNQQLDEKFHQFVQYIEEHMGIFIFKEKDFRENLYIHIDKAISRIRSGMCITNPLLNEVKKDYKELFHIVKEAVAEVFPNNFFPDDEVAYIVMYFAVALDKTMKRSFRILVVCSGGMGSSKMLAHRIEKEIPEITVKKTVSLLEFTKEKLDDYDLILTTIPLYIDQSQYLKVSPLLNKTELNQVRDEVKRHKYKTLRKITVQEKEKRKMETGSDIQKIVKMHGMLECGLKIIEDFQIVTKEESKNPHDDLEYVLDKGKEDEIKNSLEDLEAGKKYFQIPTTDLLYCELKTSVSISPEIFICHFTKTQYLEHKEDYNDVIYVLYSNQAKEYETTLLNYLVGAVVDDVDLHKMITEGNEEGIRQWIGYQVKQYIGQVFKL